MRTVEEFNVQVGRLTVVQIRCVLRECNLSRSPGRKHELMERIQDALTVNSVHALRAELRVF
jgi:hypothetical protein